MLVMDRFLGLTLLLGIGGPSSLCIRVRATPRSLCSEPREKSVLSQMWRVREWLLKHHPKSKGSRGRVRR